MSQNQELLYLLATVFMQTRCFWSNHHGMWLLSICIIDYLTSVHLRRVWDDGAVKRFWKEYLGRDWLIQRMKTLRSQLLKQDITWSFSKVNWDEVLDSESWLSTTSMQHSMNIFNSWTRRPSFSVSSRFRHGILTSIIRIVWAGHWGASSNRCVHLINNINRSQWKKDLINVESFSSFKRSDWSPSCTWSGLLSKSSWYLTPFQLTNKS